MTRHTCVQRRCITTARTSAPRPRSESPHMPRPPALLTPALPPDFEAFCTLYRDRYLDYSRVAVFLMGTSENGRAAHFSV
jgi:hypothetical protein